MDFAKLVSLLQTRALYFSRVDVLARDDPFEGNLSVANIARLVSRVRPMGVDTSRPDFLSSIRQHRCRMSRNTAVNCWHANDFESTAMWKIYVRGLEGIAVRSTFHRLMDSFVPPDGKSTGNVHECVFVGNVTYLDEALEPVVDYNEFGPFMWKRRAFEHEREVRALIQVQSRFRPRLQLATGGRRLCSDPSRQAGRSYSCVAHGA